MWRYHENVQPPPEKKRKKPRKINGKRSENTTRSQDGGRGKTAGPKVAPGGKKKGTVAGPYLREKSYLPEGLVSPQSWLS